MEDAVTTTNGGIPNEHQLWVNLSALTEGNLSGVLPRLIQEMLGAGSLLRDDFDDPFEITLPSDFEWRTKIYYKLVSKQRLSQTMEEQIPEESIVLHEWNIIPPKSEKVFCAPDAERLKNKRSESSAGPITWTVSDIAKAACLLLTPPQKTNFNDEQEMRRVYTLIYDVFRYKSILNQALQDVSFFLLHPDLSNEQSRIWLLLYDMFHRGFKKREVKHQPVAAKIFADCHLTTAENTLWKERIKLAAAIARLRIEKSALKLSDLLPPRLKDERITNHDTTPVTCWINIRKTKNKTILCDEISNKLGLTLIASDLTPGPNHFKWDPHCPHFLVLHPSVRAKLAQSPLVKKHKLIVQSKAFCVGPATFGRIIADLQLTGSVIQTHVNSPRTVAYLATLLSQNENIKKLMAFSAGTRKREYDNYFSELGMKNILIYSEKLIDMSPDAHCLEEVIAVFATPPNSYSAVTDPIDLVCGRGGDLSMLEILTESEETKQTRERVANILDEQRKTLRFAMSRPQIQFVLYETHSELDAENTDMVEKAMKEINRIAKLHHANLQGKIGTPLPEAVPPTESKEINNNEKVEKMERADEVDPKDSQPSVTSKPSIDEMDFDERFQDIAVPDCDIFDLPAIPELCPNTNKCTSLNKEGCYLALLQRKVVTNMDNKYMIQMAEARGLFGNENPPSGKKSSKSSKVKKQERAPSPTQKPKKKAKHIEVDRIAAPTLSSIKHSKVCSCEPNQNCPRQNHREEVNQPKKWWGETTRHLNSLRTSLVKQKILPPLENRRNSRPTAKNIINTFVHTTQRIDEVVARNSTASTIPVFPKLRLTRKQDKKDKIPCPITVTLVTFEGNKCVNLNCVSRRCNCDLLW